MDSREEQRRLQQQHAQCERTRKSLEAELQALRQQLQELDEQNAQLRKSAAGLGCARERLDRLQAELTNAEAAKADLSADLASLRAERESETESAAQLRAQLAAEKRKLADLLCRLRAVCATLGGAQPAPEAESSAQPADCDDSVLIDTIDQVLLQAYRAARQEAEALSTQRRVQIEEINVYSQDVENLKSTKRQLDGRSSAQQLAGLRQELDVANARLEAAQTREADLKQDLSNAKKRIEELRRDQVDQQLDGHVSMTKKSL